MSARHLSGAAYSGSSRIELQCRQCGNHNTPGDQDYADNMPPDADIVQEGDNAYAEDIEHGMHKQDNGINQEGCPLGGRVNASNTAKGGRDSRNPGMEQRVNSDGGAIVDSRGNRELADQVKPASIPSPAGSTELGSPVIQATSRWVGRSQFGHTQGDDDHKYGHKWPANRGSRIA